MASTGLAWCGSFKTQEIGTFSDGVGWGAGNKWFTRTKTLTIPENLKSKKLFFYIPDMRVKCGTGVYNDNLVGTLTGITRTDNEVTVEFAVYSKNAGGNVDVSGTLYALYV